MAKSRLILICTVLLSTLSLAQSGDVQHYVILPPHSQASIPPILLWDKGSYASWTPSRADIEGLEAQLHRVAEMKIKGWESTPIRIEHPEKYFRQYVGVRHGGKRQIYINAFYDDPPPSDWQKRLFVVIDGATGYWHAFYDPDTKAFSDLTINGRA
jgi:hypothetical protein